MGSKLAFVVGAGVGYVVGTRAGREQFDRMSAGVRRAWESPAVQEQVARTGRYAAETAREGGSWVVQRAVDAVRDTLGMTPPSTRPSPPTVG